MFFNLKMNFREIKPRTTNQAETGPVLTSTFSTFSVTAQLSSSTAGEHRCAHSPSHSAPVLLLTTQKHWLPPCNASRQDPGGCSCFSCMYTSAYLMIPQPLTSQNASRDAQRPFLVLCNRLNAREHFLSLIRGIK